MVPSGGRHLQRAARRVLPRHVGEVGEVRALAPPRAARGEAGAQSRARDEQSGQHRVRAARRVGGLLGHHPAGQHRDELAQAAHAEHRDVRHESGLGGALLWHHHLPVSGLRRGEDGRQDPPDRTHPAVQPQLPDEHEIGDRARVDHLRGPEHRRRDGHVESGAGFRHGGGAQPDRELLLRPGRPRVDHGGTHPVPALDEGLVRQSHQGEGRDPGLQVGLHLDHHTVDPDQGHRARSREAHQATPLTCSTRGAPRRGSRTPTRSMRLSLIHISARVSARPWRAARRPSDARTHPSGGS